MLAVASEVAVVEVATISAVPIFLPADPGFIRIGAEELLLAIKFELAGLAVEVVHLKVKGLPFLVVDHILVVVN